MVVPEAFRMLPPHPREAELAANRFPSFEHYREWLTKTSGDVGTLVCLYDPDYGYAAVLGEELDRHRQLLYLVRMQPCPVRRVHLPRLHEAGRIKSASLLETGIGDPHHPQAMYLVKWEDSWESGDVVHEHADSTPLFESYMQARTGAAILACSDSGQSRAQRQGHPPLEARPATGLTLSPQLAALIDIDPLRTCNPDADTLATGRFTIASSPDSLTCSVHLPCGRYAGSLPLARLDLLHTAYLAHGVQGLGFEEAVAQLLMRKRPKATGKSPTWRLPAALVSALQRGLQLDTELFASCLSFESGMQSYCSSEADDEHFGANPEAFTGTAAWAGRTLCVPAQDSASTLKALRWAIASAVRPESTSLTALIVTPAPSSGYRRWLNHPAVRELLQVPASFLQADTGDARASRSPTSRLLLLVGSTAELERIDVAKLHKEISGACAGAAATKKRSREVVAQTATQHHKWCPPLSDLRKKISEAHKCTEPCACEEFRVPGAFRRRDEEGQAALRPWRVHPELVPFAEYSATAPAWPEAQSIIYSDGSATGKNSEDGTAACKTGSGAYRAQPLLELCVDPCGLGPTNTITRAELVATYSSLRHAGPADCVIATDSQASMFMVRNQLTAPGKNAYSAHNLLLAAIADELTSRALAGHGTRIHQGKIPHWCRWQRGSRRTGKYSSPASQLR